MGVAWAPQILHALDSVHNLFPKCDPSPLFSILVNSTCDSKQNIFIVIMLGPESLWHQSCNSPYTDHLPNSVPGSPVQFFILTSSFTQHTSTCGQVGSFARILTRFIHAKAHLALKSSVNLSPVWDSWQLMESLLSSACLSIAGPQHCPCPWGTFTHLSKIASVYSPWHLMYLSNNAPTFLKAYVIFHCLLNCIQLCQQVKLLNTWIHPLGLLNSIPQHLYMIQSCKTLFPQIRSTLSCLHGIVTKANTFTTSQFTSPSVIFYNTRGLPLY